MASGSARIPAVIAAKLIEENEGPVNRYSPILQNQP
jgi:hypothetical protein